MGIQDKIEALKLALGEDDAAKKAWTLFTMARVFFEKPDVERSDYEKAAELLKAVLKDYPRWPEANLNMAVALSKLNRTKESIKYYEKAHRCFDDSGVDTRGDPADAALVGKIWLFRAFERLKFGNRGSLIRAQQEYRKGLQILNRFPDDPACRSWRGFADEVDVNLRTVEQVLSSHGR